MNQTIDGYTQCTWLCAGTLARMNGTQEICGGYGFVSVYNNTDFASSSSDSDGSGGGSDEPFAPNYLGCYSDSASRTLQGASTSSDDMTLEKCAAFAQTGNSGAGYVYYGLEYSSQCYVGNTLLAPGMLLNTSTDPPSTQCNMPCAGDTAETCGGSNALSVYSNTNYTANTTVVSPILVAGSTYQSAGCLTDALSTTEGLRSLNSTFWYADDMTEEGCVGFCQAGGYQYAG